MLNYTFKIFKIHFSLSAKLYFRKKKEGCKFIVRI